MSENPFDLGRQTRLVIIDPNGAVVQLDKIISFDAKENNKKVTIEPLNSPPETQHIPLNWDGTIEISRNGPAVDKLFINRSANFWAGKTEGYYKMFQYDTEHDGTESAFYWDKVSLSLADAGTRKATDAVTMRIEFSAVSKQVLT